jgi:putative SOS response-associated peptidase YedK
LKEGETTNGLFGFLTTEPNAEVAPVRAKAMPVILRTLEEIDVWLTGPSAEALALQKRAAQKQAAQWGAQGRGAREQGGWPQASAIRVPDHVLPETLRVV